MWETVSVITAAYVAALLARLAAGDDMRTAAHVANIAVERSGPARVQLHENEGSPQRPKCIGSWPDEPTTENWASNLLDGC